MKFAPLTLVALLAALPTFAGKFPTFAAELANPLTVSIVTQWGQADFPGLAAAGSNTTVLVDGEEYTQVYAFGPTKKAAAVSPLFSVTRDIWDNYQYWVSHHQMLKPPLIIDSAKSL